MTFLYKHTVAAQGSPLRVVLAGLCVHHKIMAAGGGGDESGGSSTCTLLLI